VVFLLGLYAYCAALDHLCLVSVLNSASILIQHMLGTLLEKDVGTPQG
jgi:hypothetical protein